MAVSRGLINDFPRSPKTGGYLGILDHAGNEIVEQDSDDASGYMNESYFRVVVETLALYASRQTM